MTIAHDVKDLELATGGRYRVEWAGREMPVLKQIRERFAAEKPLDGVRVSACLHVTTGDRQPHANPASRWRRCRADRVQPALPPKTTSPPRWSPTMKFPSMPSRAKNNETYYQHIHAALDHKPHITMDDGADLVGTIHKDRVEALDDIVGGTEETTTGVIRLRAMG